jgi:hypothetical protein
MPDQKVIERMVFELRRLEWVRRAVAEVKGKK